MINGGALSVSAGGRAGGGDAPSMLVVAASGAGGALSLLSFALSLLLSLPFLGARGVRGGIGLSVGGRDVIVSVSSCAIVVCGYLW